MNFYFFMFQWFTRLNQSNVGCQKVLKRMRTQNIAKATDGEKITLIFLSSLPINKGTSPHQYLTYWHLSLSITLIICNHGHDETDIRHLRRDASLQRRHRRRPS